MISLKSLLFFNVFDILQQEENEFSYSADSCYLVVLNFVVKVSKYEPIKY